MSCTLATPRCPEATDYSVELPPCCQSKIVQTVGIVGGLLDREGIAWWVDYGTLLGVVRDGAIIPWDRDADLGIFEEDLHRVLALQDEIWGLGLPICYHQPKRGLFDSGHWVNVLRSQTNANGLDVFPWHERHDGQLHRLRYTDVDRHKGRSFPMEWVDALEKVEWEGIEVWVPWKAEELVEHRYGSNWRVPVMAAKGETSWK